MNSATEIESLKAEVAWVRREKDYAIRWANRSVESVKVECFSRIEKLEATIATVADEMMAADEIDTEDWQRALRAALDGAGPMPDLTNDWTAEDANLAREVLQQLGFAQDASMEPGMDPRRDRVARIINRSTEILRAVTAEQDKEIERLRAENADLRERYLALASGYRNMYAPLLPPLTGKAEGYGG